MCIHIKAKWARQRTKEVKREWMQDHGFPCSFNSRVNRLICKIFDSPRLVAGGDTCHEREIKVHRANKVSISRWPPSAHTGCTRGSTTASKIQIPCSRWSMPRNVHVSRGQRLMVTHKRGSPNGVTVRASYLSLVISMPNAIHALLPRD